MTAAGSGVRKQQRFMERSESSPRHSSHSLRAASASSSSMSSLISSPVRGCCCSGPLGAPLRGRREDGSSSRSKQAGEEGKRQWKHGERGQKGKEQAEATRCLVICPTLDQKKSPITLPLFPTRSPMPLCSTWWLHNTQMMSYDLELLGSSGR